MNRGLKEWRYSWLKKRTGGSPEKVRAGLTFLNILLQHLDVYYLDTQFVITHHQ